MLELAAILVAVVLVVRTDCFMKELPTIEAD